MAISDMKDLKSKIETHHEHLSCMMITYPSTHGVFEANIRTGLGIMSNVYGQVYLDGANMNAMLANLAPVLSRRRNHLTVTKTFCI